MREWTKEMFNEYAKQSRSIWNNPASINLPKVTVFDADLNELINAVYISPYCASWQKDMIKDLITKLAPQLSDRIYDSVINERL